MGRKRKSKLSPAAKKWVGTAKDGGFFRTPEAAKKKAAQVKGDDKYLKGMQQHAEMVPEDTGYWPETR